MKGHCSPKTKIEVEGKGYFALFIDCEGNKEGLYGNE
jgi:predicted enzyme related to lactoylglutathione lyase